MADRHRCVCLAHCALSALCKHRCMTTPPSEVTVDEALVEALLAEQFPEFSALPVVRVAEGWDNVVFRLGAHLSVRMPRRAVAAWLIQNEFRWGGALVEGLTLPLDLAVPSHLGQPGCGYLWHWTIGPWFTGRNAHEAPLNDPIRAAGTLGTFLGLLHRRAPGDAPRSLCRGAPLADRDAAFREGIDSDAVHDSSEVDVAALAALWARAMLVPVFDDEPVWLHGDVHPLNLIVDRGELVAAIDLGDLCTGDPASDLAVGWMLFDADARAEFRKSVCQGAGVGDDPTADKWDALWCRGWGWALALGVGFANGDDKVRDIGFRTLHRAMSEPPEQLG